MSLSLIWDPGQGALSWLGLGCGLLCSQVHVALAAPESPERRSVWTPDTATAEGETLRMDGPDAQLILRPTIEGDAFHLGVTLVPRRPLVLGQVAFSLSTALLDRPEGLRYFRHGYASWTPSACFPWDQPPPRPLSASFAVANHATWSPWWRKRGGMASSWYGVLVRGDDGLLVGFPTQRTGAGEVYLNHQGSPYLVATLDHDDKRLRPGEPVELDGLMLAWGPAVDLPERFAATAARANGIPAPLTREAPVGWCSWYQYYTKVKDADVVAAADHLRDLPGLGVRWIQLDDGYQTAVGDWRSLNRKFSRGLGPLVQDIRDRGFEAGIWLAPFSLGRRSDTLRAHPDWALRDARGRWVDAGFNPLWMDRTVGLDLSHPGALAWLQEVFRALCAEGFTFFKLDFLYAALQHGQRHDPHLSPTEAYRQGLRAIRDAVGPDVFLLGCGAPLGPSAGLVDGMRISADVRERWDGGLFGWLGRDCGVASLVEAARNTLTRAPLHRWLWLNDPDCLLVRDSDTSLDEAETRLLATVVGMSGGLGLLSDDLRRVSEARRGVMAFVLPPTPLRPQTLDLMRAPFPEISSLAGPERRLVALLHWGEQTQTVQLPADPSVWRFEAWTCALLDSDAVAVPRHGVRAIWETPRLDRPQLVGTDLHLTGFVDGRISARWEAPLLRIAAQGIARATGRLWIALPPGLALAAPPDGARVEPWAHGALLVVERPTPWTLDLRVRPVS